MAIRRTDRRVAEDRTPRSVRSDELSWPDARYMLDRARTKSRCCRSGATEQHGPHLPTGTDTIIAHGVLPRRVSSRTGAPVLPALAIGCSYGHGTGAARARCRSTPERPGGRRRAR